MSYKKIVPVLFTILLLSSCSLFSGGEDVYVPVRISEIGSAYYQDEIEVIKLPFVELYNYGSEAVDISLLTLRCSSSIIGSQQLYDGEFELPSYSLQPGAYMLLRAGSEAHEYNPEDYWEYYYPGTDYDPSVGLPIEDVFSPEEIERVDDPVNGVFYLNRGGYFPYWTNQGFAELITRGQSVDFVRWGSSSIAYPSTGIFEGTAPSSSFAEITHEPNPADYKLRSIGRINEDTDTDSGLDWQSYYGTATPGAPNGGTP